jgi:hypothetical protein
MTTPGTGHRLRRLAAAGAAAVLIAAIGQLAAAPATAADAGTTIAIDRAHPFGDLPSDFVGLSFEMREVSANCTTGACTGNFDASKGNLAALFDTLGHSNVRIAGNQLDRDTLWVPAGQQPPNPLPSWVADIVTPNDIVRLGQFLKAVGWKSEVGINMAHYDPVLAADEANTLQTALGSRLSGAECGNEPNHYASNGYRTAPYGFAEHKADLEACADVVGNTRIAAPDLSSPNATIAAWLDQFAQAEHDRINMMTLHNYTGASTVTQLLSPQIHDSELSVVSPELGSAKAVGLPIRMDETNSAVGGGILGVSDVYASALWAFDYSMVMAQAGFAGLNFHGGLGICDAPLYNGKFQRYTPICAANQADLDAKVYTAAPEYYGLYMAARMGAGQFLPITVASDQNATAYAVRGKDGQTRIAIIEKDPVGGAAVPVSIDLGHGNGDGSAIRLTGRSLDTATGVAVQGATVDPGGHLKPGHADHLRVRHGALNLSVATGTAVIVTLDCED